MACRPEPFLLSVVTVAEETTRRFASLPHNEIQEPHVSDGNAEGVRALATASESFCDAHKALRLTPERTFDTRETSPNPPSASSQSCVEDRGRGDSLQNLEDFMFGSFLQLMGYMHNITVVVTFGHCLVEVFFE